MTTNYQGAIYSTAWVYLYLWDKKTWRTLPSMPYASHQGHCKKMGESKIVVIGGQKYDGPFYKVCIRARSKDHCSISIFKFLAIGVLCKAVSFE